MRKIIFLVKMTIFHFLDLEQFQNKILSHFKQIIFNIYEDSKHQFFSVCSYLQLERNDPSVYLAEIFILPWIKVLKCNTFSLENSNTTVFFRKVIKSVVVWLLLQNNFISHSFFESLMIFIHKIIQFLTKATISHSNKHFD